MKAQELCIGNYVNIILPEKRPIAQVFEITEADLTVRYEEEKTYCHNYRRFDPIPLTPAILEDMGFKQYGTIWRGRIWLQWMGDGCISLDLKNSDASPYIQYVHQLQNLYYCLVGKELTIQTTQQP